MCDPSASVNVVDFSNTNFVDVELVNKLLGEIESAPIQVTSKKEQVDSNKDKSTFADEKFSIFSFGKRSGLLEVIVIDKKDGCFHCSKNREFWIELHIKVDRISIKLETNDNMPPCLFINEYDNLESTIVDLTQPIFTILYRSSKEYRADNRSNENYAMNSSKGANLTNNMKKIIHTLTIKCETNNKVVSSHQFKFKWAGKNFESRTK